MDGQSYQFVAECARNYVQGQSVLECGSLDVNGTIHDLFPNADYCGVDMRAGPNVNLVTNTQHMTRYLGAKTFDWVLSLSHLEHDDKPWLSAYEMWQSLKPGGFLLVTVPGFPSAIHEHPKDYWRMSPEALFSLFDQLSVVNCDSVYDGEWATSCLFGVKV